MPSSNCSLHRPSGYQARHGSLAEQIPSLVLRSSLPFLAFTHSCARSPPVSWSINWPAVCRCRTDSLQAVLSWDNACVPLKERNPKGLRNSSGIGTIRDMGFMGVSEAATELGVSRRRVRQMLANGTIIGQRVGKAWVIERRALEPLRRHRPIVGRPWQPQSAWSLLAIASGRDIDLTPSQRSRARRRLEAGLVGCLPQLSARATLRLFYAHPSILPLLKDEPDIVLSGVSAAGHYQLDIVVVNHFEGYLPAAVLPALVTRFALDENAARPNVTLRTVADHLWPFGPDEEVAPLTVVAVDLLEADDDRTWRAGAQLLQSL